MKYLVILFEIARPYIKKVFGRTRHICPQYSTKIPEGLDPSLAEGFQDSSKKSLIAPETLLRSCVFCPYTTFHKGNFEKHMRKHTGERPFFCKFCGKTFTQKVNMLRHENSVHLFPKLYSEQ
ncbi:zinc finger and BTB domain-containing protein 8B [Parasteatoda tepidariorum]|uniref:zinc finger and BTB domain-containing protein 8B n=1 Tax=Parasteatoda tepidariorum TaxID=114398 RepID=UPI0039BD2918